MSEESTTPSTPPIVVGIDGSDASAAALKRAASIANALNTDLVAVSAWQIPAFYGGYVMSDWSPEGDCRQVLRDTVASVFGSNPPAGLKTELREGNPTEVLLDASKDAQMLVVGSRGHGGFAGLLLGSVSSACAEHAECPVLVYHGPGIEVTHSDAEDSGTKPAQEPAMDTGARDT